MFQTIGIYFIRFSNSLDNFNWFENGRWDYHRITCPILQKNITDEHLGPNHDSTYDGYKAIDFERHKSSIEGQDTEYYYPQLAPACYDCIVSSNYDSLYDDSGNIRQTYDGANMDAVKRTYYDALAVERVTQYKATQWLSYGY